MTLEELLAIEEIKRLRVDYSDAFDSQNVAALSALFCEDAVCEFPEEFGGNWVGRETIVTNFATEMPRLGEPFDTMHVVANQRVVLDGPDTAHGRCYLIDLLTRQMQGSGNYTTVGGQENPLLFLGMYEDEYRREDGSWKFSSIRLPFFWPNRTFTGLRHSD